MLIDGHRYGPKILIKSIQTPSTTVKKIYEPIFNECEWFKNIMLLWWYVESLSNIVEISGEQTNLSLSWWGNEFSGTEIETFLICGQRNNHIRKLIYWFTNTLESTVIHHIVPKVLSKSYLENDIAYMLCICITKFQNFEMHMSSI